MRGVCPCCGQGMRDDPGIIANLAKTELRIMYVLRNSPDWISADDIADQIYSGRKAAPDSARDVVRVLMSRIRRKVGDMVETRPSRSGGGYRLRP